MIIFISVQNDSNEIKIIIETSRGIIYRKLAIKRKSKFVLVIIVLEVVVKTIKMLSVDLRYIFTYWCCVDYPSNEVDCTPSLGACDVPLAARM